MPAFPIAMAAGLLVLASAAFAQQQAVPSVSVIAASVRPVTQAVAFVGRIEAIERVDIRARINGYLEEVLFKDGDRIKAGSPLYTIERGPFEASLQQAKANVLRAKAQLDNATIQRERAEELLKTNATSAAVKDDRVAQEKTAQGNFSAAEAERKTAEINLAYADIAAPISGRIGRTAVTRGNVVGPDSGVLATIVSSDPIYVTFPVSQREFLRLADERAHGAEAGGFKIVIQFSNGKTYPHAGKVDFVDVKVDRATDTVAVRASLPNPEGTLVDGQLVQVSVENDRQEERVVIPQVSLIADQQGVYVFTVDDGKAAIKRVKIGQTVGANVVVSEGLSGGELVVIGGGQSLKAGLAVKASPVERPLGG